MRGYAFIRKSCKNPLLTKKKVKINPYECAKNDVGGVGEHPGAEGEPEELGGEAGGAEAHVDEVVRATFEAEEQLPNQAFLSLSVLAFSMFRAANFTGRQSQ